MIQASQSYTCDQLIFVLDDRRQKYIKLSENPNWTLVFSIQNHWKNIAERVPDKVNKDCVITLDFF